MYHVNQYLDTLIHIPIHLWPIILVLVRNYVVDIRDWMNSLQIFVIIIDKQSYKVSIVDKLYMCCSTNHFI